MLAALSLFAVKSAGAMSGVVAPNNTDAAFEINYYTGGGSPLPSTKGDGYFVAYKVYDDTPSNELHFLKWSEGNFSKHDGIEVRSSFTEKSKDKVYIEFNITNTGYFAKKIDLGVFGDANFLSNDNVTIQLMKDNQGFQMINGDKTLSIYTANEGYYPPVDTLYIADNNETTDITKYPYFENTTVDETEGDSVIAFSWMNREVQPGDSLILGFASKNSYKFTEAPRVVEVSEKKEYYGENEETAIVVKVLDDTDTNNNNYNIKVFATFSNSSEWVSEVFKFNDDVSVKEITIPVNVGTGPLLNYTINAMQCTARTDKCTRKSKKNVTGTFVVSSPPTFEVTTAPKEEYKVGEHISVTATSNGVSFKYKFNNGRVEESSSANYDITIPEAVKPGKNYTLTLWAQNQYGVKSEPKMYNISYIGSVQEGEQGDEPKTEEPTTEGPKDEEPRTEEPTTEGPKDEEPKTEEPTTEGPKDEGPKTEEPTTEGPKDEGPKTEDPAGGEPNPENPTDGEPKTENPTDGEPKDGEPTDSKPKDNEPKDNKPKDSEPKGGETKGNNDGNTDNLESGKHSKDDNSNLLAIILPIVFAVLIIIIIIVVVVVIYKKKHPAPQDEYNGKAVPVTDSGANEENYFEP